MAGYPRVWVRKILGCLQGTTLVGYHINRTRGCLDHCKTIKDFVCSTGSKFFHIQKLIIDEFGLWRCLAVELYETQAFRLVNSWLQYMENKPFPIKIIQQRWDNISKRYIKCMRCQLGLGRIHKCITQSLF